MQNTKEDIKIDAVEELRKRWLESSMYLGDITAKSRLFLNTPYVHLNDVQKQEFLNGIRKEYTLTRSEYVRKESDSLKPKLEKLTFKIIDDSMNYLLFLIDISSNDKNAEEYYREVTEEAKKGFKRDAKIASDWFGIENVKDIMEKKEDACDCLNEMIEGATYKVLVPFDEIRKYYDMFFEAKKKYDYEVSDREIHIYV